MPAGTSEPRRHTTSHRTACAAPCASAVVCGIAWAHGTARTAAVPCAPRADASGAVPAFRPKEAWRVRAADAERATDRTSVYLVQRWVRMPVRMHADATDAGSDHH